MAVSHDAAPTGATNPYHEGYLAANSGYESALINGRLIDPCPHPDGTLAEKVWLQGVTDWFADRRTGGER
jgi:ribosome modulation factor